MTERIGRIRQITTDRDANLAHHKGGIAGMQDTSLEVGPNQVDEIIERTELAQIEFESKTHTEKGLASLRAQIDDIINPFR